MTEDQARLPLPGRVTESQRARNVRIIQQAREQLAGITPPDPEEPPVPDPSYPDIAHYVDSAGLDHGPPHSGWVNGGGPGQCEYCGSQTVVRPEPFGQRLACWACTCQIIDGDSADEREKAVGRPPVCPTCQSNPNWGERLATPAEVDAGCELGIAFDPCTDPWHSTEESA